MSRTASRVRAAVGIAVAQLRSQPIRSSLVVIGVALAVLAATLLAGVGLGVLETGEQKFQSADRDLWVTGGPMELSPGGGTVVENSLRDSHALADEIRSHEDVRTAAPIGFEAVYVGTDPNETRLLTGVGVTGTHSDITIRTGRALSGDSPHYANGTYEGEMTGEVVVDPRTAELLDVEPGDAIYVGGSESTAGDREFTVVGVSPDYGRLLGTPTVTLHLSELQSVSGSAGTDRASLIAVTTREGADVAAVESDLEREYPDHEIRTNREQLVAVLGNNAAVVASAVVLVALAVIAGVALTANLLALSITSRRRTLAALRAIGLSRRTLLVVVGTQGLLLGALGWVLAALLTAPAARLLDYVAAAVVGYENLLLVPGWLYAVGAAIGLGVGAGGAIVAGLLLLRTRPLRQLQG